MTEEAAARGLFDSERPRLPTASSELAAWFAEAVRTEIAALEKTAKRRRVELLAGRRRQSTAQDRTLFDFELADPGTLPEDASGTVEFDGQTVGAVVVSQHGNVVVLEIEGPDPSWDRISRALLSLDDTGLLRRLAEALDQVAAAPSDSDSIEVAVFHPEPRHADRVGLPDRPYLRDLDDESHRRAIEAALGSRVCYVWGPPDTGKTHMLARLVAALYERGERVLFASHTHAAIDEALFKLIDPSQQTRGPLAGDQGMPDGAVVRLGRSTDPRVDDFTLDAIVRRRTAVLAAELDELDLRLAEIDAKHVEASSVLRRWERVDQLRRDTASRDQRLQAARLRKTDSDNALRRLTDDARAAVANLERAQRSFFIGRGGRVARAEAEMERVQRARAGAIHIGDEAAAEIARLEPTVEAARERLAEALLTVGPEVEREAATGELGRLEAERDAARRRRQELQKRIDRLAQEILEGARVVFATLTKCYVSADVASIRFQTVIVDEISMALPPLLFLAARLAQERVVLVGDFLQLPPVVRSDEPISDARLGMDVFHLAGLADELALVKGPYVPVVLRQQRRMAPHIAELARRLASAYREHLYDHPEVARRQSPAWVAHLGLPGPVTFVDTSELNAWAGRDPVGLSRFNVATAAAATQLAALAASGLDRPPEGDRRPIGIVTPYAAQRRRLWDLVKDLGLTDWVLAGTAHTFQGGEAELLILDLVLDEPSLTAALTMTKRGQLLEQMRLLNVMITRARSHLVVLGSALWIQRHATRGSALDRLWRALSEVPHVPVGELLGDAFVDRVSAARSSAGWAPGAANGSMPAFEMLDERTFFQRLEADLGSASDEVIALMAHVGEYRWPRVEPWFAGAIRRGVKVTIVVPEIARALDRSYAESVYRHLGSLGAVVIEARGMHGKDIVIDDRVLYTGSLNWASNRGTAEVVWRIVSGMSPGRFRDGIQAKFLRSVAERADGDPRLCPLCEGRLRLVNVGRPLREWDKQPLKVACSSGQGHYFAPLDERLPLERPPLCARDGKTEFVKVVRGRGHVWRCPNRHRECRDERFVRGDGGDWGGFQGAPTLGL